MSADETGYVLDARLAVDTIHVCDLALCSVLLATDARYPWLILSPRRRGCSEITDLDGLEAIMLWSEIRLAMTVLQKQTGADKMNLAALGNMVRQLHVHVIARFETDDAWPGPVWGAKSALAYDPDAAQALASKLADRIAEQLAVGTI